MSLDRLRSTPPARPKCVLIVDDDEDARDVMGALINALGHRSLQAATASEALAHVTSATVDLALIDLSMPDADGCEVARRLRSTARGATIRLVALTGYSDELTRRSALDAGFDDYLVKPAYAATIERVVSAETSPLLG